MCARCSYGGLCETVIFSHCYFLELSRIRLYCFFKLVVAECFYVSKNLLTEFGYGTFVCGLRKHLLN